MPNKKKQELVQAIPPDDYDGSQATWMIKLQERGLWSGKGFHGDIMIPLDVWLEILEECEDDFD